MSPKGCVNVQKVGRKESKSKEFNFKRNSSDAFATKIITWTAFNANSKGASINYDDMILRIVGHPSPSLLIKI